MALAHFIDSDVERASRRSDMIEKRREMMVAWEWFLGGGSTVVTNTNASRFAVTAP